jgi:hypothetical protein
MAIIYNQMPVIIDNVLDVPFGELGEGSDRMAERRIGEELF